MHVFRILAISLTIVFLAHGLVNAADPGAAVPAPRDDAGWQKRHEAINDRAKKGGVDLLFVGDSITEGWGENEIWKKHYANRNAMNAGIGGDRTQHVLWRLDHGNLDGIAPKAVVVMIGTNNSGNDSAKDIALGITKIVEKLKEKLPKAKILLLAIFPRGADDLDARRRVNDGANEIIAGLDDGEHVFFKDIGPDFLEPDGTLSKRIMPDLLHLSEEGYKIWAEAIEADVARLLDEAPEK